MEKSILIVDDALFMRKVIRRNLEAIGCTEVTEAASGEEALTLFEEHKPDMMLLDITMPGISGLDVLKQVMEKEPRTTVIMCSAIGQESMIQRAVMEGAADFIVKPFKTEEFQKVVKAYLNN